MSASFLEAATIRHSDRKSAPAAASFTQEDCDELLECARYGEDDELAALLKLGVPIDHADDSGNTALHKASANGHISILKLLAASGASHAPNSSGNYPLHWAVQQGQHDAVSILLDLYPNIDVLAQNSFGRSASTEAFAKNDSRLVELVLQHPSAQKLEPSENPGDKDEADEAEETHTFEFTSEGPVIQLRELAQLGSDDIEHVLGSTPEEDKTGLYAHRLCRTHLARVLPARKHATS